MEALLHVVSCTMGTGITRVMKKYRESQCNAMQYDKG